VGQFVAFRSAKGCLSRSERRQYAKLTQYPFLWFDNQAEAAVKFYTSIFKNSKIGAISRYGDAGPGPKGSVMTASFQLAGQEFVALNGGPIYQFTPAISLVVNCEAQEEVDHFWNKLLEGGEAQQCGWLKDKYGVSWQIVPTILMKLIQDQNAEKVKRVMQAMMQMVKPDIQRLKQAYEG
jgi:predicted 3-demethylubiquinone-9 3-methyltransferase (glyoxalase superfamily)